MKLFEFQGKKIFEEYGIPVPKSCLLLSPDSECRLSFPIVLKAQVLTGGRGKAGGVVAVDKNINLSAELKSILNLKIKERTAAAVLAEEKANIQHEFYLSITYRGDIATPVLIASSAGGVDIEEVASITPEKVLTIPFNPLLGPLSHQVAYLAKAIGCSDGIALKSIIGKLYAIMRDYDAKLVEINPLASTPDGLCALDAKILLDDKAAYRQEKRFSNIIDELNNNQLPVEDFDIQKKGTITYVPLKGSVGLISDGAGTGMLTLDLIKDAGSEAANFCEMGGITSPQVIYDAMEAVVANPKVKSLLIVLIGGFNRMDEMAEGIIKFIREHNMSLPVVIRMCGTMEEVGLEMMRKASIPTYDNLDEAVLKAVALAGGGS